MCRDSVNHVPAAGMVRSVLTSDRRAQYEHNRCVSHGTVRWDGERERERGREGVEWAGPWGCIARVPSTRTHTHMPAGVRFYRRPVAPTRSIARECALGARGRVWEGEMRISGGGLHAPWGGQINGGGWDQFPGHSGGVGEKGQGDLRTSSRD